MKSWKVNKFFSDVVYDLRSRNLLPVVLMLVVAIIAVPILISGSGSKGAGSASLGAPSVSTSPHAESAVVAYHPAGLRNAKQRLNDLSPKNPFIQQYTNSAAPSAGGDSGTPLDSVNSSTSSVPVQTNSNGGSGGGGKDGKGNSGSKTQTVYSYYQTDVTIGEAGGQQIPAHNLTQFQFLPSPDKPALVYLGTSSSGQQALFLVSKDVTSVGGTGVCFPTADDCQLLGVGAGAGADFIYGPDGKTYHVQVTAIRHVTSTKPPA